MKKLKIACLVSVTILGVLTLYRGISHSGVLGSMHDLSGGSAYSQFTFMTAQVCVFCHTPHGANDQIRPKTSIDVGTTGYLNTSGVGAGAPMFLWNQALSNAGDAASGGQGYEVYTSSTLNADVSEIRVYSLMCLSCHDGVGAMNVMANPPNRTGTDTIIEDFDSNGYPLVFGGDDQIGDACPPGSFCAGVNIGDRNPASDNGTVNLTNDHPISFDYTPALVTADQGAAPSPGLANPDNTNGLVGNDANNKLRLFPNPSGTKASVECSTCHDPHNQGDNTNPASNFPFLAMSNQNSALCTNCHNK